MHYNVVSTDIIGEWATIGSRTCIFLLEKTIPKNKLSSITTRNSCSYHNCVFCVAVNFLCMLDFSLVVLSMHELFENLDANQTEIHR